MDRRQGGLAIIFDPFFNHSSVWSPLDEFMAQYIEILPSDDQSIGCAYNDHILFISREHYD